MVEKYIEPGIILLDKKSGISSAKAIAQVKARINCSKIGHAGTLDPMATGLLVCLINGATRLAPFFMAAEKVYSGTILLGTTTLTDDITGETLTESSMIPTFKEIEKCASSLNGKLEQVPPQISAVKQNGSPVYKRVRKGEAVDIAPRTIEIFSFNVFPTDIPNLLAFKIKCSKGTYIRSVARDMGKMLGCGACLASLRREESGTFCLDESCKIEDLNTSCIQSWWCMLPNPHKLVLSNDIVNQLRNGNSSVLNSVSIPTSNKIVIYGNGQDWFGVLTKNFNDTWQISVNI